LEKYAAIISAVITVVGAAVELLEVAMHNLLKRAKPFVSSTLPILPPGPQQSIPLICPTCGSLIGANGRCKCPPVEMADMDAKMQEHRRRKHKLRKYRSIDDDWNSGGTI
jgi:hypothetical protein